MFYSSTIKLTKKFELQLCYKIKIAGGGSPKMAEE